MSLKWKEISRLIEEARSALEGSSLQKIAQLKEVAGGESFAFSGFGERGGWRIWTCLLMDHTCWVFSEDDWQMESQPEPSVFVMVLRKHLLGKRVQRVEQVDSERMVFWHFDSGHSLLFELLPKRANLLLIDSWNPEKRQMRCIQAYRQVTLESGAIYTLPEPPPNSVTSGDEIRAFGEEDQESAYPYHRAVAKKYWDSVQRSGFVGYQRLWRQAWKSQTKKLNTALENAKKDLEESKEAELFHKRGMALITHLYNLGPKALPKEKKIELDGIEIPLDLSKSYSDNAENYFKKSKKMNRAVGELEARVEGLQKKAADLAVVAEKIEKAQTEEQLEALEPIFKREGVAIPEPPTAKKEKESPLAKPFLEVQSSDGFRILCGRNQAENRRVTFQEAKGSDMWVHVKGAPGAHVVVKSQKGKTFPLNTLLEAAQLCLYHSKIRKGKRAEVDYTPRKYVKAIKGTVAEVTYTGNKTLYLEADPETLKKLMKGF